MMDVDRYIKDKDADDNNPIDASENWEERERSSNTAPRQTPSRQPHERSPLREPSQSPSHSRIEMSSGDDGSDDDYAKTVVDKKRKRANKRNPTPETDEEDAQLDAQHLEEAADERGRTRRNTTTRSSRICRPMSTSPSRSVNEDEEDLVTPEDLEEDGGIDDIDYKIVPGPLSSELEKKVKCLFNHLLQEAKSIAREARKRPSDILNKITSLEEKATRKTSFWCKFQAFHAENVQAFEKGMFHRSYLIRWPQIPNR